MQNWKYLPVRAILVLMDPMVKWIGGATAAIVLALGIATASGTLMTAGAETPAPPLEQAIPVDPAKVPLTDERVPGAAPAAAAAPAEDGLVIKRVLPIDGPIKYGEWHWNEDGAPKNGPLVITVDLEARVISIFRDGYEIGAAAAMLGTDAHPTPTGTFPIISKERHNVSEKYGNAPMPWTLRLTNDGIAIHGGADVENGYASHGCIAIPNELASRLFAAASNGDKVIITRGKRIGVGDAIVS